MSARIPAVLALAIMLAVTVHAAYHLPPDHPISKPAPVVTCPVGYVHPIRWVM